MSTVAALLSENGLPDLPVLLIEPHRDHRGLWRIKFNYETSDPLSGLRDIWVSNATSFTPWLARPENLAVLGEALNIDLVAGLVGYDMPKKRSNQNKGDRNRDSAYEMLISHSLSKLRLMNIRNSLFRSF